MAGIPDSLLFLYSQFTDEPHDAEMILRL